MKRAKYQNVFGLLHRAKYADVQICKDKTLGSLN